MANRGGDVTNRRFACVMARRDADFLCRRCANVRTRKPLAELERDYIAAALRASGGNRAKAAQRLGIGAATLYRKLKQDRR